MVQSHLGFWQDGVEGSADNLNATLLQQDVIASRPSAGKYGVLFYATDEGLLYFDDGTDWQQILYTDPTADLYGLRSLGDGAQQAAPGFHHHDLQERAQDLGTPMGNQSFLWSDLSTSYTSYRALNYTPTFAKSSIIVVGSVIVRDDGTEPGGGDFYMRLMADTVEIKEMSRTLASSNTGQLLIADTIISPGTDLIALDLQVRATIGSRGEIVTWGKNLHAIEVST